MPPKKFVPAPEFFSDPDGFCSLAVAKKAGIRFVDSPDGTELIPLVVSGSPPAPSKAKLSFGHQVTKANARHHGAATPFYSAAVDLQSQLKAETTDWNPPGEETVDFDIARLHLLRSNPIGGLLLVVQHWNVESASFGEPVLQVLASPAVATLGSFSSASLPGVNLGEAWDLTSGPFDQMPEADTTCPILAMSGGFSRQVNPPTLANYLQSTAPLFFPSGEKVAGTVSVLACAPLLRAFYLPTVSSLPVGMFWKMDGLTVDTILKSIKAMSISSTSPYSSFIYVLEHLGKNLIDWLDCATRNAQMFACQAFVFDSIESQFPSLVSGSAPETIICTTTFAPLMDMRYLYAWRLLLDRVLSGTAAEDITFLRLFLSRASSCLHAGTYVGTKLLPELTPNMGLHFQVRGGWPTDSADPRIDFSRPEVSSQLAQRYDRIAIEVHPDHPAPAPDVKLITASEASARRHHGMTPKTSFVPAESLAAKIIDKQPQYARTQSVVKSKPPPPGSSLNPLEAPPTPSSNLFGSSAVYSPPALGQLTKRSSHSPTQAGPASNLVAIPAAPKWPEILTWSISNETSRLACAPEYLALCFLLIHGPTLLDINAPDYRVCRAFLQPREKQLLARHPCAHFSTRMIIPIFNGTPIGVVDSARIYMQGLLDRTAEGYFAQFFTQSFFQSTLIKALMQPGLWRMDKSFDLNENDASAFHVYNFIPSLRSYAAHAALLPSKGFTCLELRPLALFISTWFRSMDVAQGFASARFDTSIMGCRLRFLMSLLEKHSVQTLWATNARVMTYVWFQSLRSLLYLFQRLCSVSMWKTDGGFLPADPHVHVCPYNRDGQHFIDLVQDFDADLLVQWSRDRLHSADAFYSVHLVPASHFLKGQTLRMPQPSTSISDPPDQKKKPLSTKRSADQLTPDFVSNKPLFELISAPQTEKAVFLKFASSSPAGTRMPILQNPDGKSALICLSSSVGAPFNKCNLAQCLRNQTSRTRNPRYQTPEGPPPFCHIDFNHPYYANQPEAFWAPVVTFLRLPGVAAAIRPSEFLKAKTPSTPW